MTPIILVHQLVLRRDFKMNKCYKCNEEIKLSTHQKITRSDECPNCYVDLRCCKMCSFYDTKSYNDCKEPSADRITEKEKKNFCDYFLFGNTADTNIEKEDILAKASSLFK
jgi:hypothetical protein